MKLILPVAVTFAVFAFYLLPNAVDSELASGGVLPERGAELRSPKGGIVSRSAITPRSESLPTYQGRNIYWWARHAVQARKDANARGRTIRRLQSALTVRPRDHALRAIAYASTAYGVSYETLRRKAYCETGGTYDPYAKNRSSSASGLFQFLTSTWASTPYGRYSIWDPYANALAAGWMHAHGRGGEWACR